MTRSPRAPRVAIDTNLVLSALAFATGRLAPLRFAWQGGHCRPLVSSGRAAELIRVLGYPKFKLNPEEQERLQPQSQASASRLKPLPQRASQTQRICTIENVAPR